MNNWFHSGLEGYCKAAAQLLGEGTRGDILLDLCKDILPDRTRSNLTRAWTLSNVRRGRSCRHSLFEQCWLGSKDWKDYADEALLLVKGEEPEGGFTTIPSGSDYERGLRAIKDKNEVGRIALSRCEADAIEACVDRVMNLWLDENSAEASSVASLVTRDGFPSDFFTYVLPAIESGLLSERYLPSDVQRYVQILNSLTYPAHKCLAKEGDAEAIKPFLRFVISLFSGLVYGPNHPLAVSRQWNTTEPNYLSLSSDRKEEIEGTTIRLTQVFDDTGAYTGYSELFRSTQVVFLGRCPEVEAYLERCAQIFAEEPEILEGVKEREPVVYPIVFHDAVSNVHGMLLCEGDVWRLYDLNSTNGTSILSTEGTYAVDRLAEVKPGDRLRLGAPSYAHDANVYWDAATLSVSLNVDRSEQFI